MALLATKLLLAPLCVIGVSLAGRRWGVAVAGVLGGLPVVAGPILLVLTLLHGRSFGADAAAGTLLGLAALTMFVVVYGRIAPSASPAATVVAGWTAFLVGIALLTLVHPPPVGALTLVVVLTAASGALGPRLSGLLAPFPIITSVLAVFTHAHGGAEQARVLLRNFLVGFYGFAAFCFTLAVVLGSIGVAAAFAIALVAALAVQAVTLAARSRLVPSPAPRVAPESSK